MCNRYKRNIIKERSVTLCQLGFVRDCDFWYDYYKDGDIYFMYFVSSVLWCPLRFPHKKTMFGLSLPSVVCKRARLLFTLFVFVFVLCVLCWRFLWIVHCLLPLWYSLTFTNVHIGQRVSWKTKYFRISDIMTK
jgi:hypothetical protein